MARRAEQKVGKSKQKAIGKRVSWGKPFSTYQKKKQEANRQIQVGSTSNSNTKGEGSSKQDQGIKIQELGNKRRNQNNYARPPIKVNVFVVDS